MANSLWNHALHSALISALLLWLTACGGSSGSLMHNSHYLDIATWPAHSWEQGAKAGSYVVVAVDSLEEQVVPLTDHLGLTSKTTGESEVVAVSAHELEPTDHAYLHLKYDASQRHPVSWHLAPGLDDIAIFLGITSKPGVVVLGIQTIHALPLLVDDIALCEVEFAEGAYTGTRLTSVVTDTPVSDLRFNTTNREQLEWTYACPGDYNQDSRVLVSDITPIGQYYNANEESPNWQTAQVADGNDDKLVYINDLVRIGQNFQEAVVYYKIQGGPSETGSFSGEATVDVRLEEWVPVGGGFKRLTYTVPAPVEGAWYVVWAMDGEELASEHSNAAQYSVEVQLKPPTGLIAYRDNDSIFLNWNDPAGVIPDGYSAFAGNSSALLDAVPLNTLLIKEKPFLVPDVISVDSGHYFGVKAVYGTQKSEYSNIYHYQPSISGDVPQALTAVRDDDHIRLDWLEPVNGTPEYYTAYAANNPTMEDAIQVTGQQVLTTAWDVSTTFSPDQEYYFAVTATFSSSESNYSNIAHYEPSSDDNDPPTWDIAGSGIKSVTPGNGTVTVSWFIASDPSPPITYIVYYAEDGSFDWATATTEEVAAPATATVISELSNGTTYEFGVRARDNFGNTDSNTNTLKATPSGIIVPVDTGVWQTSELVDDGGSVSEMQGGWYSDVAVSAGGVVGISHYSPGAQDLLYTYGNTGDWTTEVVSSTGDTGSYTDLAFDPITDEPCIAFHNASEARLEFARRSSGNWAVDVVDDGGDVGAFASLEFDPSDNRPAIAYFDAVNSDVLYAKYDGDSWEDSLAFNGETGLLYPSGMFTSLGFDPVTQRPGIAFMRVYFEFSFTQEACWYVYYNGSNWIDEEADLGALWDLGIGTSGWGANICYSSSGVPFIIHYDLYVDPDTKISESRLTSKSGGFWLGDYVGWNKWDSETEYLFGDVEWYDGEALWVIYDSSTRSLDCGAGYVTLETIDTDGRGGMPALFVEDDGTQHVSYLDIDNDRLYYAYKEIAAESWHTETITLAIGGTAVVGDQTSMAFHPIDGHPMISYYDASDTRLKYADKEPGTWRIDIVSNARNDGGYSDMDVSISGVPFIGYLSADNQIISLNVAQGGYQAWGIDVVRFAMVGDPFTDVAGTACSLALTPTFTPLPMLAYSNDSQHWLDFSQGSIEGNYLNMTIDNSVDSVKCTDMAVSLATEQPGVACYRSISGNLYYAGRSTSGEWSYETVDANPGVGDGCSITYSSTGNPWISYYDEVMGRLKVAYQSESTWEFIVIPPPGSSTNYGRHSSIAWHPVHDRAAVTFYDGDAGKLWYVFIGDPGNPQSAVQVAGAAVNEGAYPSLKFNPLTIQPGIAYQDVDNGDLRYVERVAE